MINRKIIGIFARNYYICRKAYEITKSESVKQDMHQRMSQIVLLYSELFEIDIIDAAKKLKNAFGEKEE